MSAGKEECHELSGVMSLATFPLSRWKRTHLAMSSAVELMLPAGPITSTQCRALSSPCRGVT